MASMTFHERFGEVSKAQLAAYRKHNVSQSDHETLAFWLGEEQHADITKAVKDERNHQGSSFSSYLFRERMVNDFHDTTRQ